MLDRENKTNESDQVALALPRYEQCYYSIKHGAFILVLLKELEHLAL
jgi:hypothetical protein